MRSDKQLNAHSNKIDETSFKKQKVSFSNIKMHSVCNVKICLKYDGALSM